MRDGLSLLDQCASATVGELTAERVYACLGIAGERKTAELMGYIAAHDTAKALALFNQLYADGKEMGALLDELACLCRDLLILKTAPEAGLTMLSGVATDKEAFGLSKALSSGELVLMMELLEATMSGFTRSASRRMDAELCLIRLCQPELQLDTQSLNARLTRMEEQIKSGSFVSNPPMQMIPEKEEEPQPISDTVDEPEPVEQPLPDTIEAPVGFWAELVSAIRQEMKPPYVGFFTTSENAPVKGILRNNQVVLQCSNSFMYDMINKAEILAVIARKASAILGQNVNARAEDMTTKPQTGEKMKRLMDFGRAHSNIVNIKDN